MATSHAAPSPASASVPIPGFADAARAETPRTAFWICCRFPELPLESLKAGAIGQQALVLIGASGGAPGRSSTVLAANSLAKAQGVRPGMPLRTAYSHSPQLQCCERKTENEQQRLRQLADIAYGFTPDISLLAPDALLLECAGTLHLFGGVAGLLQALNDVWRGLEHQCALGIAHTPLAATALAYAQLRLPVRSASTATFAARVEHALKQVRLAQLADVLWTPKIIERFAASGIETLDALFALPRPAVGRRFGRALLLDLDRLLGRQPDPRIWVRPSSSFNVSLNLLEPLRQRTGLQFPMHRLLRDLVVWLRARQLLTDCIEWRFIPTDRRTPDSPRCVGAARQSSASGGASAEAPARRDAETSAGVRIELRLAQPGMDDRRLLRLTELQLERCVLPEEIAGIALRTLGLTGLADQAGNGELFKGCQQDRRQQRAPGDLLDLLQARFGAAVLHGIAPGNDHRPEFAWQPLPTPQMQRASVSGSGRALGNPLSHVPDASSTGLSTHRPLWLLQQPQLLQQQRFELLNGPERIEVAWWASEHDTEVAPAARKKEQVAARKEEQVAARKREQGAAKGKEENAAAQAPIQAKVARDYYLARSHRGELCWIFRAHDDGNWYLHGYFA